MSNEWEAGATPWLRQHQPETTWTFEPNPVQCMFCGGQTVKRSATDRAQDTGRIELYCDNGSCDAREMVLLVKRDGDEAYARADVRALNLVDNGTLDVHTAFPPRGFFKTMSEMMADHGKEVERRMRKPSPSED